MRFRLRYLQHDLELSEGEFTVGRNASCQLSLDDPLVSRRHAVLRVTQDSVRIEDLQSRNGVVVNGHRIAAPVALKNGDSVLIGGQELVLIEIPAASATSGMDTVNVTVPKLSVSSSPPPPGEPESDFEAGMARRAEAFRLLGGVAEKALAMGRAGEAERILASPLADIIEACRSGRRMTPSLVDQAARLSARLAGATGKGAWADYVIELYIAQARPCPASVIDELYHAFRRVTSLDYDRLRHYIDQLRVRAARLSAADRFLLQRLEGLERIAM